MESCKHFVMQQRKCVFVFAVMTNIVVGLFFWSKDECLDYRRMSSMDRPRALDILGNTQYIADSQVDKITLITHLSADRLDRLVTILHTWDGPIAATIHTDAAEVKTLLQAVEKSQEITTRPNIQLHLVQKDGDLYPVNYLRNTGLNSSVTTYVFPVDVDLIPAQGAHDRLLEYTHKMDSGILLVPAFQERDEACNLRNNFPKSKSELISLWDIEKVIPFLSGSHQCKKCHRPTNFPKWRNASDFYVARYERYFEPYTVGRRDKLPAFSEKFGGRYKDKISFVEEIYAKGLAFNVVPDVFLLHLWHARSDQFNKHWHRCSNIVDMEFEQYLKERYPDFSPWW